MLQNHQVQQALRLDVFITLKVGQLPQCSTVFYEKMYRPLTPYFRKTRTTEKKKETEHQRCRTYQCSSLCSVAFCRCRVQFKILNAVSRSLSANRSKKPKQEISQFTLAIKYDDARVCTLLERVSTINQRHGLDHRLTCSHNFNQDCGLP